MPDGADPIAMAYAGHQFGHFVPQLGDGRAILLGEVIDTDGIRRDIQLKGSGPTPFSRRGDGRAALGPVLREYVVSEAMAALLARDRSGTRRPAALVTVAKTATVRAPLLNVGDCGCCAGRRAAPSHSAMTTAASRRRAAHPDDAHESEESVRSADDS